MQAASDTLEASEPSAPSSAPSVSFWEWTSFAVVRWGVAAMARVFGLAGLYRFGCAFGTVEWWINYKRRRRFTAKMNEVYGVSNSLQARGACRRYFARTRCDKLFYLIVDKLPADELRRRLDVGGWDLMERSLQRERGVYVALSHFGAHHTVALLLCLRGVKVAGVRDPNEGAWFRFMRYKLESRLPETRNMRMFYSGTFPRDIFRCLQANWVLGSALDFHRQRETHLKTVPVTLFDQPREVLAGPLQIAIRCGSPILQGFMRSLPNFHYRLEFHALLDSPQPPLTKGGTGGFSHENLGQIAQDYADRVQQYVRRFPCHVSRI